MKLSLQEIVDPNGTCFGCGMGNAHGLHLQSYPDNDGIHVVATIQPEEWHCGWPGLVYGGYIAMVTDCHSNWTAMHAHYIAEGRDVGSLPKINCATGKLDLHYHKPTPMGVPLVLRARVDGAVGRATRILCHVFADDILTVSAASIFVRVNIETLARQVRNA